MTNLSNLIARVRSATGPDRELDRAIRNQLFPDDALHVVYTGKSGPDANEIVPVEPPPITASLDAAIELCERVLPGWHWSIRKKSSNPDFFEGMVTQAAWSYAADRFKASHDSAPLALILAVLLAKQGIDGHE